MSEVRHSRKLKIGVGGQPLLSWRDGVELQQTSSSGRATSAQNTGESSDPFRHPVAGSTVKQAFVSSNARMKKDNDFQASVFRPRNAPVRVSVSGEWALQECRENTVWVNHFLKKSKRRTISDIRKSIGDGITLVYLLESLAGEDMPGVYSRPITRAQKLENLQLCMSFMGNRGINLKGIYVGDLIDGNVKSVLNLCDGLKRQFEGSGSPEGPRPHSSGSGNKEKDMPHKVVNGAVPNAHGFRDCDADVRPHGTSSGYHSDEYSPPRKSEVSPVLDVGVPGMMDSFDQPIVAPGDILVSTTEIHRKAVSQVGASERRQNILSSPPPAPGSVVSLEDRLRSLLSSPNPGGQGEEDTDHDEELLIPPPRSRSPDHDVDRFGVEERLRSLLDVAEEDFPDKEPETKNAKELDKIGYVPSHPSEKLRNVPSAKRRNRLDSFTGSRKQGQAIPPSDRKQTSGRRRGSKHAESPPTASPGNAYRKRRSADGPSTGIPLARPEKEFNGTHKIRGRLIKGEATPPNRALRSNSHSEFLQQVAAKLAYEVGNETTTTLSGSESFSSAETPMLPALSPTSSVGTFFFESSSEASGMSTPTGGYPGNVNRGYSASETTTPRSKISSRSGSLASAKAKSTQDMNDIRKQLESLESMYTEILGFMDSDSRDGSRKGKYKKDKKEEDVNKKGEFSGYRKQRTKDIKAVNKRFSRLESHVVTLARSVAHLSSELRSQTSVSQDMEDMRKELQELRAWSEAGGNDGARAALCESNLKRVTKLRKFFGAEPPLLPLFLKKLGYERFAPNFEAEQVGILELSYMTEERLQSLGIPLGPRIRILQEAKKTR